MARKRTNLAVAADVPTAAAVLQLADQVRCVSCSLASLPFPLRSLLCHVMARKPQSPSSTPLATRQRRSRCMRH